MRFSIPKDKVSTLKNSMRAKLYRIVDQERIRYYHIELYKTLFGNFAVERVYGNIRYKSPTGRKLDYFDNSNDGKKFFFKLLRKKLRKGYEYGKIFQNQTRRKSI